MNNEKFQIIFDMIQPMLPEKWNKMALYVAYTSGSYSMKVYTADEKGIYTDCFSVKGINKAKLIKLFMDIDKVLAPVRDALEDNSKWSVMTMLVDSKGKMKTEFDYSDISKTSIAYEQSWRDKYLK